MPFSQVALSWIVVGVDLAALVQEGVHRVGEEQAVATESTADTRCCPTKTVSARMKPPRTSLVSVGDAVQRQASDSRWSLMVLLTGGTVL